LPLHTFVRFEPLTGKGQQLRQELKLLLEPTRAEPGCIRIHLYEALRDPFYKMVDGEGKPVAQGLTRKIKHEQSESGQKK